MTGKKIRLFLNWLGAIVFLALASFKVVDYMETKENWPLFAALIFGLVAVIRIADLIHFYRKKKEDAGHGI
jgi:membrane protein YdbS with pleckstrin-like domain